MSACLQPCLCTVTQASIFIGCAGMALAAKAVPPPSRLLCHLNIMLQAVGKTGEAQLPAALGKYVVMCRGSDIGTPETGGQAAQP